jgi:hypothetical protein
VIIQKTTVKGGFMDKLIKEIPEDVRNKIAGKMVIEAIVFKEKKFDPL